MVAIDREAMAEPVFSDRFFAKLDPWLRSLDPLSELVFRTGMARRCRRIRADPGFARRCKELKGLLQPSEAEQVVILQRVKGIEARLAALLPPA